MPLIRGGVTLASLHAAKGLEWDAVFMPCFTDGALPIIYAQTPKPSKRSAGCCMWG